MISRQMIAAAVSAIAGILMLFGANIDQVAIVDNVWQMVGAATALYGIVLAIFRKITTSPLIGWFTKAKG